MKWGICTILTILCGLVLLALLGVIGAALGFALQFAFEILWVLLRSLLIPGAILAVIAAICSLRR